MDPEGRQETRVGVGQGAIFIFIALAAFQPNLSCFRLRRCRRYRLSPAPRSRTADTDEADKPLQSHHQFLGVLRLCWRGGGGSHPCMRRCAALRRDRRCCSFPAWEAGDSPHWKMTPLRIGWRSYSREDGSWIMSTPRSNRMFANMVTKFAQRRTYCTRW